MSLNSLWPIVFCLALLGSVLPGSAASGPAEGITEPFLDVTLSASVSGILTVQKFREGDFVKEGEVILELDKRLEELEMDRRKVVMENRRTDLEATQVLFKNSKGISQEELEKRQLEHKVALVEHAMAVEQLRRRQVIAPLSGTITEIFLDIGEACQPYQPLVRVVDTRRCYFISNLEAKRAASLQPKQVVKLELETGASPVRLDGKVDFVSPVADPASGLIKVKVLFENADEKLRPGLAGRILN